MIRQIRFRYQGGDTWSKGGGLRLGLYVRRTGRDWVFDLGEVDIFVGHVQNLWNLCVLQFVRCSRRSRRLLLPEA